MLYFIASQHENDTNIHKLFLKKKHQSFFHLPH